MDVHKLIVIANPATPQLKMLEQLPSSTSIAVGETADALSKAAPDADVVLNWAVSNATLREIFGKCRRVRWVHTRNAGLDNLLFPELVESPATLTNGRGVFSQSLGEFVIGAILFFAKDFRRLIRNQQAGVWDPFDMTEIAGQTICILGYGDIGRAVASRARTLGMRVLAVKRRPPAAGADPLANEVVGPEERRDAIARADYVAVCAPLTPETRGMAGVAEIAAMKPAAVMINVGRGPVIDEQALIRALTEKRIRGAALDVFDQEPLPAGHPFYKLDNVLLSPHCADHTPTWTDDAMRYFVAQFERYRKGEPLQSVVDKKLGY